ncbi:hypothetical protein WJX72_000682 [[Myrmecia] bisecta]|uniref:Uncharacterized protein n=1 Tax=[Myrmecia] bisecta TaxID=41462 RepID=A0AAW1P210_9CHLO
MAPADTDPKAQKPTEEEEEEEEEDEEEEEEEESRPGPVSSAASPAPDDKAASHKAKAGAAASKKVAPKAGGKKAGKAANNDDILAELEAQRNKQAEQLKIEARARQELEDMLLRIERHFKAEQAARRKAEELLQQSIENEEALKAQLDAELKKSSKEARELSAERESLAKQREQLEAMRSEFESELQQARAEMQKAQEALQGAEDRVKAQESVERQKLENDYQAKVASLAQELERVRSELAHRTEMMGSEMERWRQQAEATARAVVEAKNEVMDRKKDLDVTKEKMDKLVEKLYASREKGVELTGAIDYHIHQNAQQRAKDRTMMNGSLAWGRTTISAHPGASGTASTNHRARERHDDPHEMAARHVSPQRVAPANVAFGATVTTNTRPRANRQRSESVPRQRTLMAEPAASLLPAISKPRNKMYNVPSSGYATLHASSKASPTGLLPGETLSASIRRKEKEKERQHGQVAGDRWAESRRDAGMIAYASRWN